MYKLLKENYNSPRITGEFTDCSMPMSFDQYSACGYDCLYCFSRFQRSMGVGATNYLAKNVKAVSLKKFKWYFTELDNPKNIFRDYIKNRITFQWGGLSDPFCPIEEEHGRGYELLSFLKEIRYPVNFSSKSDLILRDKKYTDLFEGMGDVWSYKASIITLDADKAKIMEANAPSPQRRIETLKKLSDMGIWTIWRLRPFIIGLSSLDYEEQLYTAAKIGCRAISTEFFCLEVRATKVAKTQFDIMSKVVGFDIVNYYKNISSTLGYLRLNRSIKKPYFDRMKQICDETGMNMSVSDAHGKEYTQSGSCCGLPDGKDGQPCLTKYSKCQFTEALKIARQKGEVCWNDIAQHDILFKGLKTDSYVKVNNVKGLKSIKKCQMDLITYMKNIWNTPNDNSSPYKYFKGAMVPDRLDEEGNIIYKYNPNPDNTLIK